MRHTYLVNANSGNCTPMYYSNFTPYSGLIVTTLSYLLALHYKILCHNSAMTRSADISEDNLILGIMGHSGGVSLLILYAKFYYIQAIDF